MKECGNCKFHLHEDIDDGWVCVNPRSRFCADWTEYEDACEEWEEKEQTMSRWSIEECQDILECAIGEVDYHIPEDVIRQTIDYLKELVKTQEELSEERSNAMWEKFPDGFY